MMNKYINFTIHCLLLLSLWAILSIGISLIPLIEFSLFSNEAIFQINSIFLNIAYSYFAGFIMYTLTVTIPFYNKKKINAKLIKHFIENYYFEFKGYFFMYCVNNKSLKLNEENIQLINLFKKSIEDKNGKFIFEISYDNSCIDWKKTLIYLLNSNKDFQKNIFTYSDYLSIEQLTIINNIKKNNYKIEMYLDLIDVLPEMNDTFFSTVYKDYKNVEKLYSTQK